MVHLYGIRNQDDIDVAVNDRIEDALKRRHIARQRPPVDGKASHISAALPKSFQEFRLAAGTLLDGEAEAIDGFL